MIPSSSITVISLGGELELSRKNEIQHALRLNGRETAVLIDFSDVTYADSTTLAELLRFYSQALQSHVTVALLIKSQQFARVIEYAGLQEAFQVFHDRSAALSYLGNPHG